MNRLALAALVAFACSTQAFAESPTRADARFDSTRSRAEVQAELASFRAGAANPWSTTYDPLRQFQGSLSRGEVSAEYLAARDEVRAFSGEDSGSAYLARTRNAGAVPVLASLPAGAR
jgi:hypothetical protein